MSVDAPPVTLHSQFSYSPIHRSYSRLKEGRKKYSEEMCGLNHVFTDVYLDIYIYTYICIMFRALLLRIICTLWIAFLYCSVYLTFDVIAFYWSLHLKLLVNINKDIIVVYYLAHHVYRLLLHIIYKQQSNDIKQKPMRMHVVQLKWYYCRMQFLNDYNMSLL